MMNNGSIRCKVLQGVLFLLFARFAAAATLYVAPDGNDRWTGHLSRANNARTDGPLASLSGARDAIRKIKAQGPLKEAVRVIVAGGEYTLAEPFTLTPADSGTKQYPITYEAAAGAEAVFSGGRRITGFKPAPGGIWQARVPDAAAGKWRFEQLYVNGRRAVRAPAPSSAGTANRPGRSLPACVSGARLRSVP